MNNYNNQPLIYVANDTQKTAIYNSIPKDKTILFVGGTKKFYTHDIEFDGNNTTYDPADANTLGLIKIGYTQTDKKYPVELDANNKAYVNVPWSNTNSAYEQRLNNIDGNGADSLKSRIAALETILADNDNIHADKIAHLEAEIAAIVGTEGASIGDVVISTVNNNMSDVNMWYTYSES